MANDFSKILSGILKIQDESISKMKALTGTVIEISSFVNYLYEDVLSSYQDIKSFTESSVDQISSYLSDNSNKFITTTNINSYISRFFDVGIDELLLEKLNGYFNKIEMLSSNLKEFEENFATKDEIPTSISSLVNDVGYLTEHQSLENYVTIDDIDVINNKLNTLSGEISKINIIDNSEFTFIPINNKIYKFDINSSDTLTIDISEFLNDECINFELWLKINDDELDSGIYPFNNVDIIWKNNQNEFDTNNQNPSFLKNNLYVIKFKYDGENLLGYIDYIKTYNN